MTDNGTRKPHWITIGLALIPTMILLLLGWISTSGEIVLAQNKVAENSKQIERLLPRLGTVEGQIIQQQTRTQGFIEEQRTVNTRQERKLELIDSKIDKVLEKISK